VKVQISLDTTDNGEKSRQLQPCIPSLRRFRVCCSPQEAVESVRGVHPRDQDSEKRTYWEEDVLGRDELPRYSSMGKGPKMIAPRAERERAGTAWSKYSSCCVQRCLRRCEACEARKLGMGADPAAGAGPWGGVVEPFLGFSVMRGRPSDGFLTFLFLALWGHPPFASQQFHPSPPFTPRTKHIVQIPFSRATS